MKDKDAGPSFTTRLTNSFTRRNTSFIAKSQLTKTNQTKTKMESLARELQKVSGVVV
jgi:hypothetical protein